MATLKNRVKFAASTSGTADFGIGSALTGFRTPAQAGYSNGQTVPYIAESADRSEWETGLGTYNTTGPVLERTTVRQSSNSDNKVNFAAAPRVFVDPLAEDLTPASLGALAQGLMTHSIPGPDWRPTITNGAGRSYTETSSNKHIEDTVDFDTTTQEFACAIWNPPKKYNGGTFTFRVKCLLPGASSTQTVDFALSAAFVRDDDANDAAFGTAVVVTDTFLAAGDLHIGPISAAVTPAGTYAAGCKLALKLQRNVSTDNAAGDARVVSVEIFWTSNAADDT